MFGIFKNYRNFIVEEQDVTTVLEVVNKHRKNCNVDVNNCGWKEQPSKWFISFDANQKEYGNIVEELNKVGGIKLDVRPDRQVDLVFERAH